MGFEKWYDKGWWGRLYRSLGMNAKTQVMESQVRLEENVRNIGADIADITWGQRWCIEWDETHTVYTSDGVLEELIDNDRESIINRIRDLFDENDQRCFDDECITDAGVFRIVREELDAVLDRLNELGLIAKAEMRDYFFDAPDYRFIVDRDGSLRDVEFCVGLGGPNIYVKTREGVVVGTWGRNVAEHSISESSRNAIRNYGEELYDLVLSRRESCNY